MSDPQPIACDLGVLGRAERERWADLAARLTAATAAVRELDDGYELELATTVLGAGELDEFLGLERRCCPFLRLRVRAGADPAHTVLRVTGATGVKEFLAAELGLSGSRP